MAKATSVRGFGGTAEAVPFSNLAATRHSICGGTFALLEAPANVGTIRMLQNDCGGTFVTAVHPRSFNPAAAAQPASFQIDCRGDIRAVRKTDIR